MWGVYKSDESSGLHVVHECEINRHDLTLMCDCNPNVQWFDPKTGEFYPGGPLVIHTDFEVHPSMRA